ncbi:MAG TPA: RidA family protein [Alphaproteobacteria bacterium]|nr:RidA family protein [Alphaproteobacteria bacterium]
MKTRIRLKRAAAAPFIPAPRAVRAGDYIFTSSIYPVDRDGHAIAADERLGEAGPSAITLQTRHCLEGLKSILEELGSSLDRVLKADVHLADAADFYEFKLVWREYFPKDPPARTTVEAGDTFPFRGTLLNLDAVALAGDSKLKRQVLADPEGPDPLAAEGASAAVRAGNLVFCSGFTASDFTSGLAVGKRPGFPNYGSEPEMQAEVIFARLNRVLAQAGTSLKEAVESQLYEPDLRTFYDVDTVWARYMPTPPARSSMGMKGLITPGAHCIANLTVLVPDRDHIKKESHAGIQWHPVKVRKVNFSPTIKAGPWRFFAGQVPTPDFMTVHTAPPGLPHHFSDIEVQTRFVLELLTRQLEANDTDWSHCHHARVYLIEPRRDYRGFIRVWQEKFPDPAKAPALAFVPSTAIMFAGPLIEIDPTCVART